MCDCPVPTPSCASRCSGFNFASKSFFGDARLQFREQRFPGFPLRRFKHLPKLPASFIPFDLAG